MSKLRYALGFAIAIPKCKRGPVVASYGGRRFMVHEHAVRAMNREDMTMMVSVVVDVGRMKVCASQNYEKVAFGERVSWLPRIGEDDVREEPACEPSPVKAKAKPKEPER